MVITALSGCYGEGSSDGRIDPADAPVIKIDGSSTVFPIAEAVAEEFQLSERGAARVTVGLSGTGGGFKKLCRGDTDIANASRPILSEEMEACRKSGVQYLELPVAFDAITVVVHPTNNWVKSMSIEDLKKIWEPAAQGKILRWNQVRPEWPDQEIHLFGAGVDSGTFDYFTEVISGKSTASRGDYTSSEDDNVIVQGVSGDPNALGYFGYAYYEQNKDKLKLVAVDDEDASNGAGPIAPSPETVAGGTYRPLSRPIFIYAKVKALQRPEVLRFVEYFLTNGAPLVREVGYIPMTEREQGLVRDGFTARKIGTTFTGTDSHSQVTLAQR